LDAPCARALAAALRRMPALRELELRSVELSDTSAAELFGAEGAAPGLRKLTICSAQLTPAAARVLAATGAVGEATTELAGHFDPAARPPTPRRWPRLEALVLHRPGAAALEALAREDWGGLQSLSLADKQGESALDAASARALAAALPRMPTLRALELCGVELPDASAAELFRASSGAAAPQLHALAVRGAGLTPAAVHMLAATGWRLKELNLGGNGGLADGCAALCAAPTFAIRCLNMAECDLDSASFLGLASTPWPLEELNLMRIDELGGPDPFFAALGGGVDAAAARAIDARVAAAIAALSRRTGLRVLPPERATAAT
jgi:hypothetical protein